MFLPVLLILALLLTLFLVWRVGTLQQEPVRVRIRSERSRHIRGRR